MPDCRRRALIRPPEPRPSLPFNPVADFREHFPPKQLDAREEFVVRQATPMPLEYAENVGLIEENAPRHVMEHEVP